MRVFLIASFIEKGMIEEFTHLILSLIIFLFPSLFLFNIVNKLTKRSYIVTHTYVILGILVDWAFIREIKNMSLLS